MRARNIWEIAYETLYLLLRGPVFLPSLFFSVILAAFAALASSWSVAEFRKILFDIGVFGFHLTGNLIAIIWSVKILAVARMDGSLEVQLASPVSRSSWMLGRFLGIVIALFITGFFMLVIWQGIMFVTAFGVMKLNEFLALSLQIMGWCVIAAVALFFASFCGLVTALFAAFSLWLAGLLTELVSQTVHAENGQILAKTFQVLSRIWNLQSFNRGPSEFLEHGPLLFGMTSLYALVLMGFFISAASLTLSRASD